MKVSPPQWPPKIKTTKPPLEKLTNFKENVNQYSGENVHSVRLKIIRLFVKYSLLIAMYWMSVKVLPQPWNLSLKLNISSSGYE